MVSSSTMKPQNVAAWAAPGTDHFSSLRCPTTSTAWTSTSRPGCDRTDATRSGAGWPVNASRFSHHSRRAAIVNATAVRTRPTVIRRTTPNLLSIRSSSVAMQAPPRPGPDSLPRTSVTLALPVPSHTA